MTKWTLAFAGALFLLGVSNVSMAGALCDNVERKANAATDLIDRKARSIPRGGAEDVCAQINRMAVLIEAHRECGRDPDLNATERTATRAQLAHLEKYKSQLEDAFSGIAESWARCDCWTNMC